MKLESVIRELGLDQAAREQAPGCQESGLSALEAGWDESQRSLPDGTPFFLETDFVADACREAGVMTAVAEGALSAAPKIESQPAARALAWHFHSSLFASRQYDLSLIHRWPSLDAVLDGDGRMLYLLVLLSGLPGLRKLNAAHSVPDDVQRATLSDIGRWFGGEEDQPPRPPWGITPKAVSWLVYHMRGELYRVGRLQYQFGEFGLPVTAFRNRETGVVIALSEDGVEYRQDGGRATEETDGGARAWRSRLTTTGRRVIGTPISPDGRALREQIAIETSRWERVLGRGAPVLHIHIPSGGPMRHAECGESLARATEFFPRHFPDRPFAAFACASWLLDSELQCLLPESSNIVRFQKEFYLVPSWLSAEHLVKRVMGVALEDLSTAPRSTSLQRALLALLESGQRLSPTGGGCFLFPEDLDWGAQVYIRQHMPWEE